MPLLFVLLRNPKPYKIYKPESQDVGSMLEASLGRARAWQFGADLTWSCNFLNPKKKD